MNGLTSELQYYLGTMKSYSIRRQENKSRSKLFGALISIL